MTIKTYTIERSTFAGQHSYGWGNGYIVLPESHPFHGLGYYDERLEGIEVHGGMTYAESAESCSKEVKEKLGLDGSEWVFGFDTAHGGDDALNWHLKRVQDELIAFANQFEGIKKDTFSREDVEAAFQTIKDRLEGAISDAYNDSSAHQHEIALTWVAAVAGELKL